MGITGVPPRPLLRKLETRPIRNGIPSRFLGIKYQDLQYVTVNSCTDSIYRYTYTYTYTHTYVYIYNTHTYLDIRWWTILTFRNGLSWGQESASDKAKARGLGSWSLQKNWRDVYNVYIYMYCIILLYDMILYYIILYYIMLCYIVYITYSGIPNTWHIVTCFFWRCTPEMGIATFANHDPLIWVLRW